MAPSEEFQVSGAQINRWINGREQPNCPIDLSILTFVDLGLHPDHVLHGDIDPKMERTTNDSELVNDFANLVEPIDSAYRYLEIQRQADLLDSEFLWQDYFYV
ncbi:hypothetical protein N7523_001426 [Penicillium sp. IBT 18751x]|nr:hypothetical protein N7523_001426 [Penicillium sp. IBT 18751x]